MSQRPNYRRIISLCDLEPVQDPAQAWNALTVGACTDRAVIHDADYNGWKPVANWAIYRHGVLPV